jgi:hypothetical protein
MSCVDLPWQQERTRLAGVGGRLKEEEGGPVTNDGRRGGGWERSDRLVIRRKTEERRLCVGDKPLGREDIVGGLSSRGAGIWNLESGMWNQQIWNLSAWVNPP